MLTKLVVLACLFVAFIDLGKAVECHNCVGCGSSSGPVYDCSIISNSPNCYLAKTASGQVSRSCGIRSLDNLPINFGCQENGGITLCKCSGNMCNAYPHIQGRSTTTSRMCHNCGDCGASAGILTDCSIISDSKNCYLSKSSSGTVSRSCGVSEFDELPIPDGCSMLGNVTVCKCDTDGCNEYRQFIGLSPPTILRSTIMSSSRSSRPPTPYTTMSRTIKSSIPPFRKSSTGSRIPQDFPSGPRNHVSNSRKQNNKSEGGKEIASMFLAFIAAIVTFVNYA